ncbi:MAG: hypothetical protein GY839_12340 [candidate division Zixibacteria bacterium]|nr:hypothetical protein [candidate division Zixibacteria bacterium]
MAMSKEPEQLRRGKAFHREIQAEWAQEAEGTVIPEKGVVKLTGRKGRVDVFVNDDEKDGVIAIVEIKASNWDRMTDKAVRRNARRQIKQIWDYIESQIINGEYTALGEGKDVCPGIIFPKRPTNVARKKCIEAMFSEEGIPVVWHDE